MVCFSVDKNKTCIPTHLLYLYITIQEMKGIQYGNFFDSNPKLAKGKWFDYKYEKYIPYKVHLDLFHTYLLNNLKLYYSLLAPRKCKFHILCCLTICSRLAIPTRTRCDKNSFFFCVFMVHRDYIRKRSSSSIVSIGIDKFCIPFKCFSIRFTFINLAYGSHRRCVLMQITFEPISYIMLLQVVAIGGE